MIMGGNTAFVQSVAYMILVINFNFHFSRIKSLFFSLIVFGSACLPNTVTVDHICVFSF